MNKYKIERKSMIFYKIEKKSIRDVLRRFLI